MLNWMRRKLDDKIERDDRDDSRALDLKPVSVDAHYQGPPVRGMRVKANINGKVYETPATVEDIQTYYSIGVPTNYGVGANRRTFDHWELNSGVVNGYDINPRDNQIHVRIRPTDKRGAKVTAIYI